MEHQPLSLSKRVREDPYTNCSCTTEKARGAARRAETTMAEDADPAASVRDEAPKPSSPRASPAKFDRAMVEAKMRSDGWVTTEKARQNAAEGSSRTTDK